MDTVEDDIATRPYTTRDWLRDAAAAFGGVKWFCAAGIAAVAAALFLLSQTPRPSDDAYITFRHVHNLVEHGVPAWNLNGPHVLGSTTPAFLFALALFAKLTGVHDIPFAALAFNSGCLFLIVLLVFLLGRDILKDEFAALLTAVLIGFNSLLMYIGAQGFEGPLFIVALLGAFLCLVHRHDKTAIVLTSLAPLIRPEGVLLSIIAWGYLLFTKRASVRLAILYAVIPAAWFGFSTWYYGSCFPHSIEAKRYSAAIFWPYTGERYSLVGNLPRLFPALLAVSRTHAAKVLFNGATLEPWHTPVRPVFCWVEAGLLPLMTILFIRRKSPALFCLAYAILFIAFFVLIGGATSWYYPSFVVCSLVTLFTGTCLLSRVALSPVSPEKRDVTYRSLCALLCVCFLLLNRYTYHRGVLPESRPWIYARDPNKGDWSEMEVTRYQAYREAAEFLNMRCEDTPGTVMTSEVGVFGYFFRGDVIDTGALCSPEVLPFYPPPASDLADSQGNAYTAANHVVPTALVEALKPCYLVNSEVYIANLERPGGVLERDYEQIASLKPAWNAPVLVYRRKADIHP